MVHPRTGHSATLLDGPPCEADPAPSWCGQVLVVGGARPDESAPGKLRALAESELYDPASGEWTTAAGSLAEPRAWHTATQLLDGRVLVAGGFDPKTGETARAPSAELYDPATQQWSATAELELPRRSDHTANLLLGEPCLSETPPTWCGRVLVAKGRTATGTRTGEAERFDPGSETWEQTIPPAQIDGFPRSGHTATLLASGHVLAAGGADGTGPRASVELYDPGRLVWAGLGVMPRPRADHAAALLADDRVLVVGGFINVVQGTTTDPVPIAGAEVFDPASQTWSFAGSLLDARYRHSATRLEGPGCAPLCDLVLVAGGIGTSGPLAAAELFDPSADPPPGSVSDLTAEALSHRKIRLRWSATGANGDDAAVATDYVVKQSRSPINDEETFARARSLCGGVCEFSPARVGSTLTLVVTDLKPDIEYHYAVRALDEAEQSGALSNSAAAKTSKDRVRPGRVTDLRADPVSPRRIRLRWSATGDDGTHAPPVRKYVVKQSRRPIQGERHFRRAFTVCTCRFSPGEIGQRLILNITALDRGTVYHYAIKAKDGAGNLGRRSNSAKARTKG